jgi:hypothetical protein
MVGRVPHDDETGADPLPVHWPDRDAVHARSADELCHDVVSAPDAPRSADLDEVVGKQRCDPIRICAARRVEQLQLARNGVVHVVHGADRTAPTERASDEIAQRDATVVATWCSRVTKGAARSHSRLRCLTPRLAAAG